MVDPMKLIKPFKYSGKWYFKHSYLSKRFSGNSWVIHITFKKRLEITKVDLYWGDQTRS